MPDFDIAITGFLNVLTLSHPVLATCLIAISSAGVPFLVLAVAGQWWRVADRRQQRHVFLAAGFSFLAGLAMNQIILLFVHRMRPYDAGITHLLIAPSADFSFPSDHATAAFAIAAAFLMAQMRWRGLAFLAAAGLIAFARVGLGIHYFGDVLGGAVTGVLAALLVQFVYRENTRIDRLLTGIF